MPGMWLRFSSAKIHGKQRKNGHIKDIYCPKCDKIQQFQEYKYNQVYKTLDGEIINKAG